MQIKSSLLLDISNYYSEKVSQFGCTPNGVDWNGKESQFIRFKQLLKICEQDELFSLGVWLWVWEHCWSFWNIQDVVLFSWGFLSYGIC